MRIRHSRGAVAGTDMTPMIDMVFQLIAFFMIVTNFEQTQADERVKLPADELAVPPAAPPADELVLNVGYFRDEGRIIDPQAYIFQGDETIPVLDYGRQFSIERRNRVDKYGEESLADVTVVIRADAETPLGLIQELMKLAQEEGGFSTFSLKAKAEDREPG